MIGLVAALTREVGGVLTALQGRRRERSGDCLLCSGRLHGVPVAIAVTGMGEVRARQGARLLLARHDPSTMLSLGFAGALTAPLAPGALVVPERLLLAGGDTSMPAGALAPDAGLRGRLLSAVERAGLEARGGASVTTASMVGEPEERAALARACGAEIVDMEGYWLAREAAAAGVPFVSVRAVSDTLRDHHPVLAATVGNGELSPLRLLLGYAVRPREAAKLPRLRAGARAASDTLRRAVFASVPHLAPEAAA